MSQLSEHSGFDEEEPPLPACAPPADVYKLSNCEHMMHRACLLVYMKNSAKVSQCVPACGWSIVQHIIVQRNSVPLKQQQR